METLEDILNKMRCGMIPKHRHDRELLLNFADRIEQAVTSCNQLKMREALVMIQKEAVEISKKYTTPMGDIVAMTCDALVAKPRNCDRFEDYGDAIRAFGDEGYDYETIEEWLFDEVKGGSNENN